MFNPWLCLLTDNNKKYIITSFILFVINTIIMYGLVYLLTGKHFGNSWEIRIIFITISFYMVVAYGMMMGLKLLFLDLSDGGLSLLVIYVSRIFKIKPKISFPKLIPSKPVKSSQSLVGKK